MSIQVPTAHVEQYKSNVYMLAQQKGSRLRRTVRDDGDIIGKSVYFDRIGPTSAQKVTTRHGDTPLMNTPHSRRKANLWDYDWADLVDWQDKLKTIYDPVNPYARNAAWAMGRSMDDLIIEVASDSALTGVDGSTSVALPSDQKIAVNDHTYDSGSGDVGLTISKLIYAREILDAADVDPDLKRYIIVTAKQVSNLMTTTEVTSMDFNTVKALHEGRINEFMGFEFIRTQRLATDASNDRLVLAYTEQALGLMTPKDVSVDIGPRRDKRNSTQVYACMSIGAVRIEDEQLVEIACSE